ncbi:DNA-binding response regulator [Paenibacillus macerans]|uniref:Bacterial regulatory s, luxR family protein n=1 Tax=Paenibacillus macerans TaxID=44252 RepID=A0A090Z9U4_PAEMA|nr:response regulator transcription factor [Paenibacillus macerans]KFN08039.1 bacterial regulatory s, luxR family protein [Paenibacillus macerans]MCY7560050.1 response regulator transcription factor [Paenibacillus macerans]MEC0151950.1 response regulator transcription factor [Paenibacillus macerans]SUA84905.1 LuxR family two component transcriptional regulator [Paenibacillus macerans]GJM70638.1 DNA-binding response regulator [Paenibacillus macerans]
MSSKIRVMIVDDHDMVRMGLKTYLMLDPGFEVVAEAGDGEAAVELLEQGIPGGLPDIILMDLMMPVMNGAEATKAVLSRYPQIKIVILTSFLEDELVVQAVEAGAVSYVLKTVSAEELIYALQGAYRGMPVMTGDVAQALTRGLRQRTVQGDDSGLTEREKEVLLLIAEGKTNKDIAEELHISIKTVKTHVSNLLMKCELDDRTQLAIYAHRQGWASRQ